MMLMNGVKKTGDGAKTLFSCMILIIIEIGILAVSVELVASFFFQCNVGRRITKDAV